MFKISSTLLKRFHMNSYKFKFRSFSSLPHQSPDIQTPFASTVYIEQMYNLWLKNPENVHSSWHQYFQELQAEELTETKKSIGEQTKALTSDEMEKLRSDVIKIYFYIRSFNKRGHELANLDPLSKLLYIYIPLTDPFNLFRYG